MSDERDFAAADPRPGNGASHADEAPRIGGQPKKIRVPLDYPVEHGGETLTEVEVHELRFTEVEQLANAKDKDKFRTAMRLYTRLPPSVIQQLYQTDLNKIGDAIGIVSGEAERRETGET